MAHRTQIALGGRSYSKARKSPPAGGFREGAEVMLQEGAQAKSVKQLFDLTGRVAIITGGSIGLGRQMAEGLAEMGAHLVLARARRSAARKLPRNCRSSAGRLWRWLAMSKAPPVFKRLWTRRSRGLG